jgi:hypothetical protein
METRGTLTETTSLPLDRTSELPLWITTGSRLVTSEEPEPDSPMPVDPTLLLLLREVLLLREMELLMLVLDQSPNLELLRPVPIPPTILLEAINPVYLNFVLVYMLIHSSCFFFRVCD